MQPPRPAPDGSVSADVFLSVVQCFVLAVHCTPPPSDSVRDESDWVMVDGEEGGDGGARGVGVGFGPEHLAEVDAMSRLVSAVFR